MLSEVRVNNHLCKKQSFLPDENKPNEQTTDTEQELFISLFKMDGLLITEIHACRLALKKKVCLKYDTPVK